MARDTSEIIAHGREEAARANDLQEQKSHAAARIRERYEPQMSAASWPRKIRLWAQMRAEIRRELARIEREVAPREGLYLMQFLAQGERKVREGKRTSAPASRRHSR